MCEILGWHQDFILCSWLDRASSLVLYLTARVRFDVYKYLCFCTQPHSAQMRRGIYFTTRKYLCVNTISVASYQWKKKGV